MNNIHALHSPKIFRPLVRNPMTWHAWEIYLRGLFGLGIEHAKALKTLKTSTGLESLPAEQVRELFVICDRRSGKSFMSAVIASYLAAFNDWSGFLSPRERG